MSAATPERMLSFSSAGALIDKSPRTVRRLVDAGRIRAVMFLGSLRIPESEMSRFIADEVARSERAGQATAAPDSPLKLVG